MKFISFVAVGLLPDKTVYVTNTGSYFAAKLQMFGGEICRVHGKVDRARHGNSR